MTQQAAATWGIGGGVMGGVVVDGGYGDSGGGDRWP